MNTRSTVPLPAKSADSFPGAIQAASAIGPYSQTESPPSPKAASYHRSATPTRPLSNRSAFSLDSAIGERTSSMGAIVPVTTGSRGKSMTSSSCLAGDRRASGYSIWCGMRAQTIPGGMVRDRFRPLPTHTPSSSTGSERRRVVSGLPRKRFTEHASLAPSAIRDGAVSGSIPNHPTGPL